MPDRLTTLRTLLTKTPTDPFLTYALALELKSAGQLPAALDHLSQTLSLDPTYLYAYYQQGQIQEQLGDTKAAKAAYETGLAAARKAGDAKAQNELQGALDILGD